MIITPTTTTTATIPIVIHTRVEVKRLLVGRSTATHIVVSCSTFFFFFNSTVFRIMKAHGFCLCPLIHTTPRIARLTPLDRWSYAQRHMPSRTPKNHSLRGENQGRKLARTTGICSYLCTRGVGLSGKTPPNRIALCHVFFVRRASSVSFILIRRRFRDKRGNEIIPRIVCTREKRAGLPGT